MNSHRNLLDADSVTYYTHAWRDYKRRRDCQIAAYLSFVTVVGGGILLHLAHLALPVFAYVTLAILSFAAIGITEVWYFAFPCPRCGSSFFRGYVWKWRFASKCMHCGLPK